jgi:hypothetical protein
VQFWDIVVTAAQTSGGATASRLLLSGDFSGLLLLSGDFSGDLLLSGIQ